MFISFQLGIILYLSYKVPKIINEFDHQRQLKLNMYRLDSCILCPCLDGFQCLTQAHTCCHRPSARSPPRRL